MAQKKNTKNCEDIKNSNLKMGESKKYCKKRNYQKLRERKKEWMKEKKSITKYGEI